MTTPLPAPRYRVIDRTTCSTVSLDQQLPTDHPVRLLWDFVSQLDLQHFRKHAKAVEGRPGNPIIPAELLFALWLFATIEGITSARELAERTTRDLPYQWLCGGQPVNYHTLADFFSQHADALHQLFVEHVAALRQQGLIDLVTVTLDGRKIVANASKEHYHREGTLQQHLREAEEHLQRLQDQREEEAGLSARKFAARQRAARERVERLQAAVRVVHERQKHREQTGRSASKPEDARANETDPDAAKMKMPHGGFQQAFNVETVTDERNGLIVTVGVTNQASDYGQLGEMMDRVEAEQKTLPNAATADGGFHNNKDIERLEKGGVEVLMPLKNEQKELDSGKNPYARKRDDSDELARWRARMGTSAAQSRYRRRAPVAEGVHARAVNRGWVRFRLRGLRKAQTEALWQALSHNVAVLMSRKVNLSVRVRAELNEVGSAGVRRGRGTIQSSRERNEKRGRGGKF